MKFFKHNIRIKYSCYFKPVKLIFNPPLSWGAGLSQAAFFNTPSFPTFPINEDNHEDEDNRGRVRICARQTAYQRWFQESIPKAEWELIREAVKRNWAYGNKRFKEETETALQRRFEVKKAGREPKI